MLQLVNAILLRARARHPRWGRTYHATVRAPMLNLMAHLRGHGAMAFTVSGRDARFLHARTGPVYGGAPDPVTGSGAQARLAHRPSGAGKRAEIAFSPRFAADSRGQTLRYATSRPGRPLALLVHRRDVAREDAYHRHSKLGALHEAVREGRSVVSMKADWRTLFLPASTSVVAL
jgi:hypothetical protein